MLLFLLNGNARYRKNRLKAGAELEELGNKRLVLGAGKSR